MGDAAERRIAVGFFDGVHLGHRAILRGADAALTFDPHPLRVVSPEAAPKLLTSLDERLAAIRAAGVKDVFVIDFTRDFSRLSAAEFLERTLEREFLGFGTVRCGANWRFGRGGEGDWKLLSRYGLKVELVDYELYDGAAVSSSRIRSCLAGGDVESANAMLGREYSRRLRLVPGKGVGASLGFATVNFRVDLPLAGGVYSVTLDGAPAIANYGFAPTAGEDAWPERTLEVHRLDGVPGAGPEMEIAFRKFIRPERKFASFDELRRQILIDCDKINP